MPTILSHAVVALAAGTALGPRRVPPRLLLAGAVAAVVPDLDVAAFALGIDYADAFGHRGASHSLVFAAALGMLAALAHRWLRVPPRRAGLWIFACTASHALLDAVTNGGLGVALAWPWSDSRFFAPWRPIQVSPIGAGFFSARGLAVLRSELPWLWLPALVVAASAVAVRRSLRSPGTQSS